MRRTIGYRYPGKSPRGDYQATCADCGSWNYRHKMLRRQDGNLVCMTRDCSSGLTADELDRLNNESAHTSRPGRYLDSKERI